MNIGALSECVTIDEVLERRIQKDAEEKCKEVARAQRKEEREKKLIKRREGDQRKQEGKEITLTQKEGGNFKGEDKVIESD